MCGVKGDALFESRSETGCFCLKNICIFLHHLTGLVQERNGWSPSNVVSYRNLV